MPSDLPDSLRPAWASLAAAAVRAGTLTAETAPGFVDAVLAPLDLARWIRARIEADGLLVEDDNGPMPHPLIREYAALVPVLRAGLRLYGLTPELVADREDAS